MQDGDILLVQDKYVMEILKLFDILECKSASTPLEPSTKLTVKDSPLDDLGKSRMEQYPYRQVVGKLMYLAVCTRPDICQAVSELSRFNNNPGKKHWESAMRVLRYLCRCRTYVQEGEVDRHMGICRREPHQLP